MSCRDALLLTALLSFSCNRQPARTQAGRLAVLRFENFSADPAGNWMGRAFSDILITELSGAPDLYVIPASRLYGFQQALGPRPISAPGISTERALALAAGANRIAYGEYSVRDGRIDARLSIEDPQAASVTQAASVARASGVIDAATALARQISTQLRPYGTQNPQALQAWIAALESPGPASADGNLERAIAADPDFGPPYRMLAERKVVDQDRAGAEALLETALSRSDRIAEPDRERLQLDLANLTGDAAARQRSLLALLKLDPRDAIAWRSLAETAMTGRQYRSAADAYRKLLQIEPEDTNSWNQLGYASSYAGDLNGAVTALRRYQSLRPQDPNPLDSLGDAYLLANRFHEADDYYLQAARKSPDYPRNAEVSKAALARLMSGDVPGADALSKQYADAREAAGDPLVEAYRGEWSWISGRRRAGYGRLAAFAQGAEKDFREAAARSYGELAIWNLMLGDHAAASDMARKSAFLSGPASSAISAVARFLVQGAAPADEWAARAETQFAEAPSTGVRDLALAYALLLDKQFAPASLVLKKIHDRGGPGSDEAGYLLAWSLIESGHIPEAAPLLRWNPIPQLSGPGAFLSFYFPRVYYLRGIEAESSGKPDEARTNYRLFLQLSGPDALVWNEEKKARANL